MNVPQEAIEAATREHIKHNPVENRNLGQYRYEITCSCGHIYRVDGHSEDRQESFLDHVNSDALTAALPALEQQIREQIAMELIAEASRLDQTKHLHDHDQNQATALVHGVRHAAQIARGEQA